MNEYTWMFALPRFQLHSTLLHQVGMHLEHFVKHMGLMTHSSSHTFASSKVQIVLELGFVIRMSTLVN